MSRATNPSKESVRKVELWKGLVVEEKDTKFVSLLQDPRSSEKLGFNYFVRVYVKYDVKRKVFSLFQDAEGEGSVQDKAVAAQAVATPSTSVVVDSVPGTSSSTPPGSDTKKKSNRCQVCRKKVGLTGKSVLKLLRNIKLSTITTKQNFKIVLLSTSPFSYKFSFQ